MIYIFGAVLMLFMLRVIYSAGEMWFERDWPRATWRGLLIAALLLFLCFPAFGQVARFDVPQWTINTSTPQPGGLYPMLAFPNARVQVCATWTNGVAACNTLATTYTDSTGTTPCSTATQLVSANSGSCSANSDSAGGIGGFIAPGSYALVITTSYGTYGPYQFGVDAAGAYCLLSGCTFTGPITGTSATFSLNCTPAVSTTVPNSQPINARCTGAVANDGTDQTAHIQACINQATASGTGATGNAACYIPSGTYHVCNLILPPSVKVFGDTNRTTYLTSTVGCVGDLVMDNGTSAVGIALNHLTINGNNEPGLYSGLNLGCKHDVANKAVCTNAGAITPWGSNAIMEDVVVINVPNGQCYKVYGNVATMRDMATNACQGVITGGNFVITDGLQVGAATGTSTGCAIDDQGNNDTYIGLLEVEAPATGVTPYCGNHGAVDFEGPGVSANNSVATTIPSIYNCNAGTGQCVVTNAQWVNSASLATLTNWGVCGATTYAFATPTDCHLGMKTGQNIASGVILTNGVKGVTQNSNDNTTLLATDQYVDSGARNWAIYVTPSGTLDVAATIAPTSTLAFVQSAGADPTVITTITPPSVFTAAGAGGGCLYLINTGARTWYLGTGGNLNVQSNVAVTTFQGITVCFAGGSAKWWVGANSALQNTVTGTTAGTAVWAEVKQDAAWKMGYVNLIAYENTTVTAQTITLPASLATVSGIVTVSGTCTGVTISGATVTLPSSMGATQTGLCKFEGY